MKVDGKDMRPIWFDAASEMVQAIDQRFFDKNSLLSAI